MEKKIEKEVNELMDSGDGHTIFMELILLKKQVAESSQKTNIPYTEIKHPVAHLSNDQGEILWWYDGEDYHYFDNIPSNYPRWVIGTFDSFEDAKKNLKRLLREGWTVIENNMEEYEGDNK